MVEAAVVFSPLFKGLVEGFAALGAVTGVASSFLAWRAVVFGKEPQEIGDAVNYGIAYGFIPGIEFAGYIFLHYAGVTF